MFKFLKGKKLYLIFLLFLISCSYQEIKNTKNELSGDLIKNDSINLINLKINLLEADKKLIPKLIKSKDGKFSYRYIKIPGEGEVSLDQLKERILLGIDFYKSERDEVITLLKKVNELKINNKLGNIDSGALGLWIPKKDLIMIDYRVIDMGSLIFLNVLRHEVIHTAQSCFGGSRKKYPKRIGLPLEFSKDINLNLSHNLYNQNNEEVILNVRHLLMQS